MAMFGVESAIRHAEEGRLRGNLRLESMQKSYYFVLSSRALNVFNDADEPSPFGMLQLDDVRSVRAMKRDDHKVAIVITTKNQNFRRTLTTTSQLDVTEDVRPGTTARGTEASHDYDQRAWWQLSWLRVLFPDDAGRERSTKRPKPDDGSQIVLVADTLFEADAWVSAIREAQAALISAAENQNWFQVTALARAGHDVNSTSAGNLRTALHYAAGYGEVDTAVNLVLAGANVNARDRAGMTPLGWACLKGHVELAHQLLKANADPLLKAHSGVLVGKTAITLARLYG